MRFTRRKALASIGMVGFASSAVFGSGAFTQTVADREFDLQIAADDNALLSLTTGSESYDAVGTNEVTGSSRDLLEFDFSDSSMQGGVNNQADTAFSQAFKITNNTSEAVWVWIPAGAQSSSLDASAGGLLGSGNRSTEFRVESSYSDANGFTDIDGDNDGDNDGDPYLGAVGADGTTGEGDNEALDLSFPPGIPKSPNDVASGDPVVADDYGNAAEQSRAFGMTPGGAVQLGATESVEVGIRFLIRGSTPPSEQASLLRLTASREQPSSGDEDALDDWESDYSRVNTG